MSLNPGQAYNIAKRKDVKTADANEDGVVDLITEMTFGHAYYAADSDKAGTNYMKTILKAFVDGRNLITSADGAALTAEQRNELKNYASIIKVNWEKVIAEAENMNFKPLFSQEFEWFNYRESSSSLYEKNFQNLKIKI